TSIIRDITERKKVEEELRESEGRYRLIVEGTKVIAWEFDPIENIFTFVSGQAREILGYPVERWYEKDFMESHIYHEDRKSTVNFCTKAFENGEDHEFEYRMVSAKGRIVWLRDIVQVVKKDGKPISTRGVMIDITERKRAEEELLKHRDHLEELVNSRTDEIKLIQKIAVSANEASTVDEAMLTCLSEVCGYTGWEIGHVYIPDDEGGCVPTDLWRMKKPERFDAFLKVTMESAFPPGVGLPGRVYKSGEPVWIKDVTMDTNFPRAKIAEDIGMKAGFAFPVMERENVVAVLEFFTTTAVEPDQLLLDTVKHLASQLGRLAGRKRTERELLLKNHAIDSSMDAMMMTSPDFEITYVNQKMCELWGYAEKELLGRNSSILRAEDRLKGAIQKILSEKGEHEGEFLTIRKDGSTFIAHFSSSMVKDENGKIVSNITSFVDLTERIRNEEALRESSRQLEESQRVANLGTYTLDIPSGICSTSIIHDRIYGINNPKYIVNIEGWLNIIHPDQREEIKSYFTNHVLAKGARFDKEYRIIRLNDRQERWVHDIGELILDQAERPVKMIGTVQDITDRKRAEKALIAAKEAAEAATKLKDKFVSLASHDLRSPISSITGFLNFLKSDTKNTLCPEHEDIVNRMILTTDHQLNMIDGLLDLTRMQTGSILLEPRFANANLIGEDVVQNMLFMAQAKEITLVNDIPANARLYADITYFSEVIGNLVSNAIKFCDKGDLVRLFAPDNKKSIIAVSDTGIGIDSKTLCKLFAQEDKTSTVGTAGEKGSGLGLPYSYEIMQAHGGKLYAESTIGEGTVLFAKLPYIKPQILIVDDDERVRGMIKAYVDPLDVYIKQAVNGSEAIEILKLFVPHLIITDISMPVLDGLQLLEHVRSNPAIKSVPVIIMTGTDIHLREKAFQMQASDFITKPLMEDEFLPRIRRFIG
ncbi:MAG TPA: PAS domain S-box protein, partial [Nitrospirae bacterium]|nr:PAS domain S-box protein [Nitrospirota bacterium]